jgi:hypothetical protein
MDWLWLWDIDFDGLSEGFGVGLMEGTGVKEAERVPDAVPEGEKVCAPQASAMNASITTS